MRIIVLIILIILTIIPIGIIAENNEIVYYENKIIKDSIFQETYLFYGKDYGIVKECLITYDSIFMNTERIISIDSIIMEKDTLYQIDVFGIINRDISEYELEKRKEDIPVIKLERQVGFWEYVRNKRASRKGREFFKKFDRFMRIVATISAITIIGLPITLMIGIMYGLNTIFDWTMDIILCIWEGTCQESCV